MILEENITYVETYLTLRCNLNCSYCINENSDVRRKRNEISGKEWVKEINKIGFGNVPLTIGGGEPTLHKGFYEFVNGIKPETKLDLLTNLSFDTQEFIENTGERFRVDKANLKNTAYKKIRVSYHPERHNPSELVKDIKRLQEEEISIGLFGINHPKNLETNIEMSEIARNAGIYFFIKDFLGEFDGQTFGYLKYPDAITGHKNKEVYCKSSELLIDPAGEIYKCHRDLYHQENPIGKLGEELNISQFRICKNYGECNPCDVKLKTNRFLQMGSCSVEITEDLIKK